MSGDVRAIALILKLSEARISQLHTKAISELRVTRHEANKIVLSGDVRAIGLILKLSVLHVSQLHTKAISELRGYPSRSKQDLF